jgi:SAM-dependent methyltransferase
MTVGSGASNPGSRPLPKDSDWLLPFLASLRALGPHLLEVGCGPGLDAVNLLGHGFAVTAFDHAEKPLLHAATVAAGAWLLRADIATPLPFRDAIFDGAVSSLALHYFTWAETRAAFAEVRRVLRPGAPFLFRVNATDDVSHGAGQGDEIETNFFRQPGAYHADTKRFFDDEAVRAAVAGLFQVGHLEHRTIHRYAEPKQVWECLARASG